jgi:hypothetical protein
VEFKKKTKTGGEIMLEFKNFATEKGLRLVAKTEDFSIEIGLHFTAKEGDFYLNIYNGENSKFILLSDFQAVMDYVTKSFGENNLEEFKEKADKLHREMYQNKYIKKWKNK